MKKKYIQTFLKLMLLALTINSIGWVTKNFSDSTMKRYVTNEASKGNDLLKYINKCSSDVNIVSKADLAETKNREKVVLSVVPILRRLYFFTSVAKWIANVFAVIVFTFFFIRPDETK